MSYQPWWKDLPSLTKTKEDPNIITLKFNSKCKLCNSSLIQKSKFKYCNSCKTYYILRSANKYLIVTEQDIERSKQNAKKRRN